MVLHGVIKKLDTKTRIMVLRIKKKLYYFNVQNRLLKRFKQYLVENAIVTINVSNEPVIKKNKKIYTINFFIKVIHNMNKKRFVVYDDVAIKDGIKNLLTSQKNMMFVDFELSMYTKRYPNFKAEILQAGIYVVDNNYNVLETYSNYVKPSVFTKLNTRIFDFLSIDRNLIENGIEYNEFYNSFKSLVDKYNPTIIVWGTNDITSLNDSYTLNNKPSITKNSNFINLLSVYKTYFNLVNDKGVFSLFEELSNKQLDTQKHDALEDARITMEVCRLFTKLTMKED